jgi:hypothetical protein
MSPQLAFAREAISIIPNPAELANAASKLTLPIFKFSIAELIVGFRIRLDIQNPALEKQVSKVVSTIELSTSPCDKCAQHTFDGHTGRVECERMKVDAVRIDTIVKPPRLTDTLVRGLVVFSGVELHGLPTICSLESMSLGYSTSSQTSGQSSDDLVTDPRHDC